MKNILRFFKAREYVFSLISALCIVIQVFFDMLLPEYISRVSSLFSSPGVVLSNVLSIGGQMLLFALGSMVFSVITAYLIAKVAAAVTERMRNAVFEKTMELSIGEVGRFSSSSLITRCTGDIMLVQMLIVTGLQVLIKAPVTAVWGIGKIARTDYRLTVAMTIAVLAVTIFMVSIILFTTPLSVRLMKMMDSLNAMTKEHISGIQVIRAFLSSGFHVKRFRAVSDEMRDVNIRLNRIMAFMNPGLYFVLYLLNLAMVLIGASMVDSAILEKRPDLLSQILSFSSYALLIVSAFIMLVQIFMLLPRVIVSLRRIGEVIDTDTAIKDGESKDTVTDEDTAVEFKNVSFRYEGSSGDVVSGLSFKVNKGETLAVIGPTGSGKTTLVNMIPRLYDPTEGEITVNGRNIKDYKVSSLRNLIGYVPQKSFLFTGTIAANIDYGDNGRMAATLSEIKKAAEIGQAREFIDRKEKGFESEVAAGGANFSGGQRQRLTISRAVCRDPEIYIFDDSFSALDFKTDMELRTRLRENSANATVIIVAQRIGTIRNADRILVLENGRIVGNGDHDELMRTCDVYREIALSQMSDKEADAV